MRSGANVPALRGAGEFAGQPSPVVPAGDVTRSKKPRTARTAGASGRDKPSMDRVPEPHWICLVTGLMGECALPLGDLPGDLLGCANGHRFVREVVDGTGTLRRLEDVATLIADEPAA